MSETQFNVDVNVRVHDEKLLTLENRIKKLKDTSVTINPNINTKSFEKDFTKQIHTVSKKANNIKTTFTPEIDKKEIMRMATERGRFMAKAATLDPSMSRTIKELQSQADKRYERVRKTIRALDAGKEKDDLQQSVNQIYDKYRTDARLSKIKRQEASQIALSNRKMISDQKEIERLARESSQLMLKASRTNPALQSTIDYLKNESTQRREQAFSGINSLKSKTQREQVTKRVNQIYQKAETEAQYNKIKQQETSHLKATNIQPTTAPSVIGELKNSARTIMEVTGLYYALRRVMIDVPTQMYKSVKDINSAQIELRKVSDASPQQLSEYWETAAVSAKKYGSSIADVIRSTADWSRLGYKLDDAKKLSDATTMIQRVGDRMTQETASEGLISTLKGFQLDASEATRIIDEVNEVSNRSPIDTAGMFEALKRSASSMYAAGNTLEQSMALITAANSVVQDPASIGTAFKTMSMRIRGAELDKDSLEADGVDTEGMVTTTAKLRKQIKALSGVDIMLNDSTFKETFDILDELSYKWRDLSDIQQATVTELIAGKRQGNIMSALMSNFDIARDALDIATNQSVGSAERELGNYQKGIEYHLQTLGATFEQFSTNTLDSGAVIGFTDALSGLLNILTNLQSVSNGMALPAGLLGSLLGSKGLGLSYSPGVGFSFMDGIGKTTYTNTQGVQQLHSSFLALSDDKMPKSMLRYAQSLNVTDKSALRLARDIDKGRVSMEQFHTIAGTATGTNVGVKGNFATGLANISKNMLGNAVSMLGNFAMGAAVGTAINLAAQAVDAMIVTYDEKKDDYTKSNNKYLQAKQESDSAHAQLTEVETQIKKINKQPLTFASEAELSKLQQTRNELETTAKLKDNLVEGTKVEAASKAYDLYKTRAYRSEYNLTNDNGIGNKFNDFIYKNDIATFVLGGSANRLQYEFNDVEYGNALVAQLQTAYDSKKEIQNKIKNSKGSTDKEKLKKELDNLNDKINQYKGQLATQEATLADMYASMSASGDATYNDALMDIKAVQKRIHMLDAYESDNPVLKNYMAIDSFFSSKSGSYLKTYFQKLASDGKLTGDAIKAVGLSIEDIECDNLADVVRYFKDIASESKNVGEIIEEQIGSFEAMTEALDTDNQGKKYDTISQSLTNALNLEEEGRIGLDDYTEFVKFVLPQGAIQNDGKATARDYANAFTVELKERLQSWFTENPLDGITNFQNSLKDNNLANFTYDDNGHLTKLETTFRNTADGAKQLGVSAGVMDAMLHKMEEYGVEVNAVFSSEALKRYGDALSKIKSLRDSIDTGTAKSSKRKDELTDKISGWDEQYEKFSSDLASLDESHIVNIEFEYDLQTVQSDIDKLQDLWDAGQTDASTGAALIVAKQKKIELTAQHSGITLENAPVEYGNLDNYVAGYINDISTAKTEAEKSMAQSMASAMLDMQGSFQSALADGKVANWDEFIQTSEYIEQLNTLTAISGQKAEEIGSIFKETPIKISADISSDEFNTIENKIKTMIPNGGSIKVPVTIDGKEIEATATNLNGEIQYTANIDGVIQILKAVKNDDGTVTFSPDTKSLDEAIASYKDIDVTTHIKTDFNASSMTEHLKSITPDQPLKIIPTIEGTDIIAEYSSLTGQIVYYTDVDGIKSAVTPYEDMNGKITFIPNTTLLDPVTRETSGGTRLVKYTPDTSGLPTSLPPITRTVIHSTIYETTSRPGSVAPMGKQKAYAYVNGNFSARALANGTATAPRSTSFLRKTLVGEEGREIVVTRSNRWYTVGDNGAEFVDIPSDALVFNAKQTEGLLNNGSIQSRGKALLSGTAMSSGNTTSDSSDDFKEKFDEIEILISRMSKSLEKLTDSIESYSYNLSQQSEMSDHALNQIKTNLSTLQSAYDRYIKEANSVSLDESWRAKVRDGRVDIEEITDKDLNERISDYKNWYEKALGVQDTIADMQKQLVELATEKIENIETYFENRTTYNDDYGYVTALSTLQESVDKLQNELNRQVSSGHIKEYSNEWYNASSKIADAMNKVLDATVKKYQDIVDHLTRISSTLENSISLTEAKGNIPTENQYAKLISLNNESVNEMFSKRQTLIRQQAIYDVGSTKYDELSDKIEKIDDDIFSLFENIEKIKDKIWEIRWKPFFDGQDALSDLKDEADDLRSLLHSDSFIGKNGELTVDGITNLALISQSMIAGKQSIRNYQEALRQLDKDLQNGNISTAEYNEQQKHFLEQIRRSTNIVEDYRDEITSLWKSMLEKENDVIQKSISKHKELLQVKKDNDSYGRNVRKQVKDINAIEAQINALQGINNESAKAELKRLQEQLNEAKETLDETQRDHEFTVRGRGYDTLSNDLNDAMQDTLDEVTYNSQKQEEVIGQMLNHVVTMYQTAYGKIQQIVSTTGFTPSTQLTNGISHLQSEAETSSQINKSQVYAPKYTPNSFVSAINTAKIQSTASQQRNTTIQSEIEKTPDISNRPVAQVTLSASSITLIVGASQSISAKIRPTDAKNKQLQWTSSNSSVATVSNGTVRGVKQGTAQITCRTTDGSNISVSCSVTVNPKPQPAQPQKKNSGDNVARVGDRATLNGTYYYDSWGTSPAGNRYSGVENGVIIDSYSNGKYGGNASFTGDYDVHIRSADGVYGDLGWVKLSQLSGYAKGSKRITHTQIAKVNELGDEIILRNGKGNGDITTLQYGDSVIPHHLSENMFQLAANAKHIMQQTHSNHPKSISITNHYDNLLTVNGDVTKDTLPKLKEILEEAYQYTTKKMTREAKLSGQRRTL